MSLLTIAPEDREGDEARFRASQIFYDLFRAAPEDDRPRLAASFLDAAISLHLSRRGSLINAGAPGVDRFRTVARQILEISLNDAVRRTSAAKLVLDDVRRLGREIPAFGEGFDAEWRAREVQVALIESRRREASDQARSLWIDHPDSPWSARAAAHVLRALEHAWRSEARRDGRDGEVMSGIIEHGSRVLEAQGGVSPGPALGVAKLVAEVRLARHQIAPTDEDARLAREICSSLISIEPHDPSVLRLSALAHEAMGESEAALDEWRRLSRGLEEGTNEWFEARYHFIMVLATRDEGRAREVLSQLRALHPEFGGGQWRARFEALSRQLTGGTSQNGR